MKYFPQIKIFETNEKGREDMKKIRAVLAGCGGMSGAWLNLETVKKKVDVVGFVDVRKKSAVARANEFGASGAVAGTDLKKILKTCEADVVFDCSVPEAHCEITLTALRHGCHVLGEKPMADSMSNARKMVAASKKAGKIYVVIQNRRYDGSIRALRKFLDSGVIGKVTTVQSNFFLGPHFGGFRDRMKHVLLLDMAIHTFDAARLITGADAKSVYCHEWNPSGSWYDHDASAVAIFEMTGGIVYTYEGSWCCEGCNTSWEASWRIIGEKGCVLWDGGTGIKAEQVKKAKGFHSQIVEVKVPVSCPKQLTGGHEGIMRSFINCIEKGGTPETVCTDNIKSLAMVHGAVESACKGRKINMGCC